MTDSLALEIDISDPTPPYEQLRRQITSLINSGALTSGQRLPPLRQLAADLGLAVGTVARTYRELEAADAIVSRRGGGTRVSENTKPTAVNHRRAALREQSEQFVRCARHLGVGDEMIRAAISSALSH